MTKEQMAQRYVPCTCGHPYTSRNLTAPDCPYHNHDIEELMDEWAEAKSQEVAMTFHEWMEDSYRYTGYKMVGTGERLYRHFISTYLDEYTLEELFLKYKQSRL